MHSLKADERKTSNEDMKKEFIFTDRFNQEKKSDMVKS